MIDEPPFARALIDRYRVERELGAGGMATVYLAHDLKHDRHVALKVLHPDLAAALGAQRFLAEIKTTANLQHPHILPLYDSGEAGGYLFYVMPFVEGESLRERLQREQQLAIDDALDLAQQVAGALDYAHRHGVIHRDIKPENILLHEGTAFVADFGIALAVQSAGGARMTQTGLSLGTPQYMSPEQAMGEKQIDARSDTYALGAILYEMLTGEPPFTGPTLQAVVAKVISSEPEPVTTLRKTVPPHVAAAVHRALQKLPADRFQTTAQFAQALHAGGTGAVPAVPIGRGAPWRRAALALGAAVVVVAAVLAWMAERSNAGAPVMPLMAQLVPDAKVPTTFDVVALSPDGRRLAFVSTTALDGGRIWLRTLADGTEQPVPGTEGTIRQIFWAPDGSAIGFFAAGFLRSVDLASGLVRTLAPASNPAGGAWSSNGTIVYSPFYGTLWKMSAVGGKPENLGGALGDCYPSFLPDGNHFLYWNVDTLPVLLMLGDVRSGARRELARNVASPTFVAPDAMLFFQSDSQVSLARPATLFLQRFDPRALELEGTPVALADAVERPGVVPIVTATPSLLLARQNSDSAAAIGHGVKEWLDPATGRATTINGAGPTWTFRISHDGRHVVLGGDGFWIYDVQRDIAERLSSREQYGWIAVWSPDDRAVAVASGTNITIVPTGGGTERVINASTDTWADPVDWSRDGAAIYFIREPNEQRPLWELWRYVFASNRREHVNTGAGNVMDARVSSDGRWIAWESDATGRREIYLGPASGDAPRTRISKDGGGSPRWRGDGRELYFIGADGRIRTVNVGPGAVPTLSEPRTVSPVVVTPNPFGVDPFLDTRFDVTPAGDRFLIQTPPAVSGFRLTLWQGWQSRMPSR